jgi:NADPH:quinone reductase-like Zn-dependent oxidoreductase
MTNIEILTFHLVPGINQGDDISGIVYSVGSSVKSFRPGDRVASFHEMLSPHGSFAEYAVGLDTSTFHLPDHVSFEEGVTIPLAGMTAALGLYQRLGLPLPWLPSQEKLPLVCKVYFGSRFELIDPRQRIPCLLKFAEGRRLIH